jgi:hypothetical protein
MASRSLIAASRLVLGPELRAGADEAAMRALQQAHLLGVEAEALAPTENCLDPREQPLVHHDHGPVTRHHRRHLAFDRLQSLVRVRPGEIVEDAAEPAQPAGRTLQRLDRIREIGFRLLGLDRLDLGPVPVQCRRIGLMDMLRADLGEGRQTERRLPDLREGIAGQQVQGFGCGHERVFQRFCIDRKESSPGRGSAAPPRADQSRPKIWAR